jgi:hypothetical protein
LASVKEAEVEGTAVAAEEAVTVVEEACTEAEASITAEEVSITAEDFAGEAFGLSMASGRDGGTGVPTFSSLEIHRACGRRDRLLRTS